MLSFRDFEFLRIIGTGAFGKVFLARYLGTESYYAIKRMDKLLLREKRQLDNIYNESKILQEVCCCPFIVNFLHMIETEQYVFLVMEYVKGGELFYYIRKYHSFSDYGVVFFAAEILVALKHMHSKNILYRDLKPENVLISESGHVKLADFGFATQLNENVYTICGTPEYMAPEKLLGNGDAKVTDYWSLGCLIYEMLCGEPPFYAPVTDQIYNRVLHDPLRVPKGVSPVARDLLEKLLAKEQEARLGINGCQEIMDHPFFHDVDWKRVERQEMRPPIIPDLYHFEAYDSKSQCADYQQKEQTRHTYRRVFM